MKIEVKFKSMSNTSLEVLSDIRQSVLVFFDTKGFRSKFMFELVTEDLRNELKNDLQNYLAGRYVGSIKVCDVEISGDTHEEFTITVKNSNSVQTVKDMLEYIKKKVQREPDWGNSGYRILGEDSKGEVHHVFDYEELLSDLDKLEKMIKRVSGEKYEREI